MVIYPKCNHFRGYEVTYVLLLCEGNMIVGLFIMTQHTADSGQYLGVFGPLLTGQSLNQLRLRTAFTPSVPNRGLHFKLHVSLLRS